MLQQTTCEDSNSATFSQESVDGVMRSDSPDGQRTDPCGQAHAPANHLALLGNIAEQTTADMFGLSLHASSASANLQLSLENKLRVLLDVGGSLEYVLTWKRWDMPSGPPICALRARARPTSDNGFTPRVSDHKESSGANVPENGFLGRQVFGQCHIPRRTDETH